MAPATPLARLAFIDGMKAIASQLIVLHHLAFYGPMSDVASELAPTLIIWLSSNARIAVQVFLVIGGFLAAKALAPEGKLISRSPLAVLKKRYFKLVVPYAAAILFSVLCAGIARQLMHHDSIPGAPTPFQLIAHVALLQSILGYDSLSAGVWYVAIDFQLFASLLGLLWLVRGWDSDDRLGNKPAVALVAGLALASLLYFNRDASWDNWAPYFFGSYAMGVLSYWASRSGQKPGWLSLIACAVATTLIVDFRSRIAVALLTSLALGISCFSGFMVSFPKNRWMAYLGKISYSVFLVHFPIVLLFNAVFSKIAPSSPVANATGILLAWGASVAAGAAFYRVVESRSNRSNTSDAFATSKAIERLVAAFRMRD